MGEAAQQLVEPREHPVLFNSDMVRAILAGTKTQARRVVKIPERIAKRGLHPRTDEWMGRRYSKGSGQYIGGNPSFTGDQPPALHITCNDGTCQHLPCPLGFPGDLLWVRETWKTHHFSDDYPEIVWKADMAAANYDRAKQVSPIYYLPSNTVGPWKPSIHMPRWASRLTLRVTDVRVERVQSISKYDACREGALRVPTDSVRPGYAEAAERALAADEKQPLGPGPLERFRWLWDSVAAKGASWDDNPWTWAVTFERVTP